MLDWVCTPNPGSRGSIGPIQMCWHSAWLYLDWTRVHRTPAAGQLHCSCQLPRSIAQWSEASLLLCHDSVPALVALVALT
jgi:hypothetical protein